jgi:hypothetical protein
VKGKAFVSVQSGEQIFSTTILSSKDLELGMLQRFACRASVALCSTQAVRLCFELPVFQSAKKLTLD